MKKMLFSLQFLAVSNPLVWADGFKDAVSAYQKQDYKTALPIFINTAQQGRTNAQFNLGVAYVNAQ